MNHHEASRKAWTTHSVTSATVEEINAGSLQRIADATEKMAASYDQLRNDRDFWKERAESRLQRITKLEHRTAALRGVITRMKRKGAN